LRNFGVQGIIAGISGLLIARPKLYTREEKLELEETVKRVVVGEFGRKDLTIVANLDIGHTDPRHILPYGAELRIDPEAETLTFAESFFA
jgi:muramoyltetrapeptide carboxypeptidase LdcA involved in peptidoglycan recycling